MVRVYVSIGSNVEREHHIRAAVAALRARFGPLVLSRVYETEAVGFNGPRFYNLVVGFDTDASLETVAAALREIEHAGGRRRDTERFGSRTLDLDLLLYGERVEDRPGLRLPRPDIDRYPFVLGPLAEIAAERRHPVSGETYGTLWQRREGAESLTPVALDLDEALRDTALGEE